MHNLFDFTGAARGIAASRATLVGARLPRGAGRPPHVRANEGRQAEQTGAMT